MRLGLVQAFRPRMRRVDLGIQAMNETRVDSGVQATNETG